MLDNREENKEASFMGCINFWIIVCLWFKILSTHYYLVGCYFCFIKASNLSNKLSFSSYEQADSILSFIVLNFGISVHLQNC